ncbi:MAG: hypothetical protein ACKVQQ_21480 [Burkholderiales bacterium]
MRFAERLVILRRMCTLVFFSLFTVVGGNLVLLFVPQARETLFALDDGSVADLLRFTWLALAYLYWAFTAWFVSRLMLGRRFPHDRVGIDAQRAPFAEACARWLPRLLGVVATLPLGVAIAFVHLDYGLILGLLSLMFLGFVWKRRSFSSLIDARDASVWPGVYYGSFERIGPKGRTFIAFLVTISWAVFLAVWLWPIEAARALGAPALLLVALASWTLTGSMLLTYWPRTRGRMSLLWVPVILLIVFSGFDNHRVAGPREAMPKNDWRGERPPLMAHYDHWMRDHPIGQPVYLVAASGGASRSAYWTAATLVRFEEEARGKGLRFAQNIYMYSGVSGGSLGIASFAALAAARPSGPLRAELLEFVGRDFLSPLVGMALFPDLLQRFVPIDWLHPTDRSLALERAWQQDWKSIVNGTVWSEAPTAMHLGKRAPLMVFNTTRLEDNLRLMQSNVRFDLDEAFDLFELHFDTARMTLAGAVHNSARFPYASPPGLVHCVTRPGGKEPQDCAGSRGWGRLGDGGYHETSGAATILDVIGKLIQEKRVRHSSAGLIACPTPEASAETCSPVVVIQLENLPTGQAAEWQFDAAGKSHADRQLQPVASWRLPELSAPLQGLVKSWQSAGKRADWRLAQLAGAERYVELRLPSFTGRVGTIDARREPSMNWYLDKDSRSVLDTVPWIAREVAPGSPEALLFANAARLRACMATNSPPATNPPCRPDSRHTSASKN